MTELEQRYEALWQGALASWQAGEVQLDALLASGQPDRRRGLSLMIRPEPSLVAEMIRAFGPVSEREPEQYYYPPSDYHVTLLSLFTATERPEPFLARTAEYERVAAEALAPGQPFAIHFRGVTASPGAIMIQGYPSDNTLETLRERVRAGLKAAGLGQTLDQRYRLQTAHVTVARFRHPLRNPLQLRSGLEALRRHNFGVCQVREIALVENDWYMSASAFRAVRAFPLR